MRPRDLAEKLEQRRRALELLDEGRLLNEVGRVLGCAPSSVMRWRDALKQGGVRALEVKTSPGRPPKLATAQRKELVERLLEGAMADLQSDAVRQQPARSRVFMAWMAGEIQTSSLVSKMRSDVVPSAIVRQLPLGDRGEGMTEIIDSGCWRDVGRIAHLLPAGPEVVVEGLSVALAGENPGFEAGEAGQDLRRGTSDVADSGFRLAFAEPQETIVLPQLLPACFADLVRAQAGQHRSSRRKVAGSTSSAAL